MTHIAYNLKTCVCKSTWYHFFLGGAHLCSVPSTVPSTRTLLVLYEVGPLTWRRRSVVVDINGVLGKQLSRVFPLRVAMLQNFCSHVHLHFTVM